MENAYFENFDNQYKITKYLIKDIALRWWNDLILPDKL